MPFQSQHQASNPTALAKNDAVLSFAARCKEAFIQWSHKNLDHVMLDRCRGNSTKQGTPGHMGFWVPLEASSTCSGASKKPRTPRCTSGSVLYTPPEQSSAMYQAEAYRQVQGDSAQQGASGHTSFQGLHEAGHLLVHCGRGQLEQQAAFRPRQPARRFRIRCGLHNGLAGACSPASALLSGCCP